MSTKIRLQRGGAKKKPYYRVVIADSRAPRDGKFIERVGSFNPLVAKDSAERLILDKDRVKHWLDQGAVPSERVAILIDSLGIANDNPQLKSILKKRANTIEIKKEEIANKKAEDAAKAKAEADAKAKEEAETAAAEAEAKKAEAASEEANSTVETPAE